METKHIFVINPTAGKHNCEELLTPEIHGVCDRKKLNYEIYITQGVGDATRFVKKTCEENPNFSLRFYACGGDGTLNEVVNGAVGAKNVAVGALACGSGNDFIKSLGEHDFKNLVLATQGVCEKIDLIYIPELDRYSNNICTVGFDADVAAKMPEYKKIPFVSGKLAYIMAVVRTLLGKMWHTYKITLSNGQEINDNLLLATMANGNVYGGQFIAAPKAKINDGIMDFCAVKKLTRLQVAKFIASYAKGTHLENPSLLPFLNYQTVEKVEVCSNETLNVNIDGEIVPVKEKVSFEIKKGALNFIIPTTAVYNEPQVVAQ